MATNGKDTIYIDIDDEITTIIDKVRASDEKIVALVLPKRASVLQSIVNMKLLKRSADSQQKRVVLITSEAGLVPLAGTVGLYVAKTLQSKPEIPVVPGAVADDDATEEASLDDGAPEEVTAAKDGDRPVGELAGAAAAAPIADDAVETLELDDDPATPDAPTADKAKPPKEKKNKKLAVPNFERFRLWLVLGGLAVVLLIAGIIFALTALPKAEVVIKTDSSDINSSLTFTADKSAKTLDTDQLVVPAQQQQTQKTQSQQVSTTGKQNNGQKATGSVTMTAGSCSGTVPNSISAGIPLTGSGLTYILGDDVSFTPTVSHGHCTFQGVDSNGDNNIPITAQQGGSNYNVSGNFSVYARSDVSASGSASGGTDNVIQVVSQSDIDSATQKIAAQDTSSLKQQLESQLKSMDLFPLESTFNAAAPSTKSSSNVGDQATTVTVTQTVDYTMYGVKENDLKQLVDNDVKGQIDPSKQTILNEGLSKADFHVNSSTASSVQIAMTTVATAGPDLHADAIKKSIAGKKAGQVSDMLKADPGVVDVKVNLSPFWVSSVPDKASKVTITFQKASQ